MPPAPPSPAAEPGAAAADAPPGAAAAGEAVRVIALRAGQRIQATVAAIQGERVWFGFRGSIVEARTALPLVAGESYELVVAATEPHVRLVAVPPAAPAPSAAPVGVPWQDLLGDLLAGWRDGPGGSGGAATRLRQMLADVTSAAPSGRALHAFARALGHDHEAAVLRLRELPAEVAAARAAELRENGKALALLAAGDADTSPRRREQAGELAAALTAIERDNAQRRDAGAPLWLPLPAAPRAGLLDARLFLREEAADERDARRARGEPEPFTIVVLLELSRLGGLRVDLTLRERRLDAVFTVAQQDAIARLQPALAGLRERLCEVGLEIDFLQLRPAPGGALPVHDLRLPPRDGSSLVDCRA